MKNIFKLLLVCLAFTACDSVDSVKYNSNESDGPTFISFSRSAYTLPIERDSIGQFDIVLNSSTVADFDRTYDLILNEEESTANPLTYSVPSSITIPAGSYQGIATVTGQDLGLVEAAPLTVSLTLGGLTDEDFDSQTTVINVREVCSLSGDATFTGLYTVTQTTQLFPWQEGPTPIFSGRVELMMGSSQFERTFVGKVYPGVFNTNVTVTLSLGCDFINLAETIDSGNGCSATNNLQFKDSPNQQQYSREDDSEFFLTVSEDATASCLSAPRTTTLRFNKVQ